MTGTPAPQQPPISPATPLTTVYLLRHGEVFNPTKVLYGRLPGFRLSEAGERMADAAAAWLRTYVPDTAAVFASPLERARQTAAPVAAAFDLEIEIDPRLIESANVFEGGVVEPGPAVLRHPNVWRHMTNPLRPSWGEPYTEIAARMLAAVADARDAHPDARPDSDQADEDARQEGRGQGRLSVSCGSVSPAAGCAPARWNRDRPPGRRASRRAGRWPCRRRCATRW